VEIRNTALTAPITIPVQRNLAAKNEALRRDETLWAAGGMIMEARLTRDYAPPRESGQRG
jgi:hypothetical protein